MMEEVVSLQFLNSYLEAKIFEEKKQWIMARYTYLRFLLISPFTEINSEITKMTLLKISQVAQIKLMKSLAYTQWAVGVGATDFFLLILSYQ